MSPLTIRYRFTDEPILTARMFAPTADVLSNWGDTAAQATSGAAVADFYVSKSGNNSWNGTAPAFVSGTTGPKLTVAAGLALLSSGQTLAIRTGTYSENLSGIPSGGGSFATATKVMAYNGEVVTLTGGGASVLSIGSGSNWITIDGLNLTASGVQDVGQLSGDVHHIRLMNLVCTNSAPSSGEKQGIICNYSGANKVHHCEFLGVTVHSIGIDSEQSHGIYCTGQNNLFDGCLFYNNAHTGMQLFSSDLGTSSPDDNIVRNCIFRNNGRGTSYGTGLTSYGNNNLIYNNLMYDNLKPGCFVRGTNHKLYNNTVYSNGEDGIILSSASGILITNNIVFANGSSITGTGGTLTTNFTTDPSFVSAPTNLHLQSGSGARTGGTDLSGTFTTDKDGVARPQGATWSRGAYEFV